MLAGPGSGKTSTLTERTGRLISSGVPSSNILCLTFTNAARDEMRDRIAAKHGDAASKVFISNFHGLCGLILRKQGSSIGYTDRMTIADTNDQIELMSKIARARDMEVTRPKMYKLAKVCNDKRENLEDGWQKYIDEEQISENELPIITDYLVLLKSKNQCDFSGMLSETVLLLTQNEELRLKLQNKFRYIQVDEYQDTNRAQNAIVELLSGPEDNMLAVGDIDQCQPAGTLVQTTNGMVDISELDDTRHRLVSFSRSQSMVIGWKDGFAFKKSARPYSGPIVRVEVDGVPKITQCTPNHRWTVRMGKEEVSRWHAVYLMKKGDMWRVGRTQLYRSHRKSGGSFGPSLRARQEKADAIWVLRLLPSVSDAQMYEQRVSCLYGIPTLCFNAPNTSPEYLVALTKMYSFLPNVHEASINCLADHGRDLDFPIWQRLERGINADFGKRMPTIMAACNLLPEVMQLPVPIGGKEFEWRKFKVDRKQFEGVVYSLDVDRHHHYLADGLITHNSIYEWRGASPDNIPTFINNGNGKTGCTTVKLGTNYRSTPEIIEAADRLIRHNRNREVIEFSTINANGKPPKAIGFPTPEDEANSIATGIVNKLREGVPASEIAVLYRTNDMSRLIEQALAQRQVPYLVKGTGSFYDRMEIKDTISMLRFVCNPKDGISFARIANKPTRGMGDGLIGKIETYAETHNIDIITALRKVTEIRDDKGKPIGPAGIEACMKARAVFDFDSTGKSVEDIANALLKRSAYKEWLDSKYEKSEVEERWQNVTGSTGLMNGIAKFCEGNPGASVADYLQSIALYTDTDEDVDESKAVRLMSLHAAKGTEFEFVAIIGVEQTILPHKRSVDERPERGLEEERRLFYVGITRAKKEVLVSFCARRAGAYGAMRSQWKSHPPSQFLLEAGLLTNDQFKSFVDRTADSGMTGECDEDRYQRRYQQFQRSNRR